MDRTRFCPDLDITPPDLSALTFLPAVPPLGLGTSMVEDVRSYMMRMAFCFEISAARLLLWIMPPFSPGEGSRLVSQARSSAGLGSMALAIVDALGRATTLSLQGLTMLPLRHVLSPKNLLRPTRAWCRACLDEMLEKGEPYEPLLWSILSVAVCPTHGTRLESLCHRCKKPSPYLVGRFSPGSCGRCGTWQGQGGAPGDRTVTPRELRDAQDVADLIRLTRDGEINPQVLRDRLRDYVVGLRDRPSADTLEYYTTSFRGVQCPAGA